MSKKDVILPETIQCKDFTVKDLAKIAAEFNMDLNISLNPTRTSEEVEK